MAKTYILEPTEAEFTASQDMFRANVNFDWTTLDGYPGDEAEDEEIDTFLANTFSGSKFEMMYGEEPISLLYAEVDFSVRFTVSGEYVEDNYPRASVSFYDLDLMRINVVLAEGRSVIPVAGTYTVSIYTGEDDPEPSEEDDPEPAPSSNDISRNFAFSDHSRNDMDGIVDIMDDLLGLNKKESDPVTPDDEGGEVK